MRQRLSTEGLARLAARRPWLAIAAWTVVVAAALVFARGLDDVLTAGQQEENGPSESARGYRMIKGQLRADAPPIEFVVIEVDDPADLEQTTSGLVEELRRTTGVVRAVSYLDGAPGLATADGQTALVQVALASGDSEAKTARPMVEAVRALDRLDGVRAGAIGDGSSVIEFQELAKDTLERGELIGVSIAVVILLLVFGAAVAAGLPLILGIAAVVIALGVAAVAGRFLDLSTFVTNIITMIGLAVGIDYSLFIVQRFREERARGLERLEAVAAAGATASRAVFFSGIAVVIALTGLLIMPDPIFQSLGIGAIFVVVAAVAAALTLLPAVLALLGDRINWLSLPGRRAVGESREGGVWTRITRAVTARPLVSVVVSSALLIGMGAFVLGIELGTNGISSFPETSSARRAYEVLNERFGGGATNAHIVVSAADVQAPAVHDAITALGITIARDGFFGHVVHEQSADRTLEVITVATKGDSAGQEARDALRRLREQYIPQAFEGSQAEALVTGETAFMVDSVTQTRRYMPVVFAFVLGFSFLLLLVIFRSVVIPVTSVLMNLLSVGAAYGAIVLVFQRGVGAGLLGFQQVAVIESWLPLFLFSILFGLSMDYHVFLLSRIKERYDETRDNSVAVEYGLRSTGAIITGAAAIMVAVFGGFALGDLAMFQQMGFGLAVAVILDATIVRSVLVPASMELLGERNWYFPRWLAWLPQIHIEGAPRVQQIPASAGLVPAFAEGGE